MTNDQKLIEDVRKAYNAKDLKELCEMNDIEIPYITFMKWHSNGIPKNGTGKQYLQSLLKIKELEKEKLMYKNFFESFKTIIDYQNDKLNIEEKKN